MQKKIYVSELTDEDGFDGEEYSSQYSLTLRRSESIPCPPMKIISKKVKKKIIIEEGSFLRRTVKKVLNLPMPHHIRKMLYIAKRVASKWIK